MIPYSYPQNIFLPNHLATQWLVSKLRQPSIASGVLNLAYFLLSFELVRNIKQFAIYSPTNCVRIFFLRCRFCWQDANVQGEL
jgi:hypothetical protein